ncbi:hypothetical protein FNH22_25385 [Fulvivirga sp. M361]|uniref:Fic/DOC family protein n=1 Tax=Fulvivirga sp. M361 TaxID=2594266 RepID=UPI00117B4132|nr:Fic family protein [Fulvivirga sp. M361]TRX50657.1 hypothetical protein FNH22_25385 [Fulvivirga sp. M361]
MGQYTPPIDDNLLNISDRQKLNEEEARGVIKAEQFIYDLEEDVTISADLILKLHHIAFSHLYEWAGAWRRSDFQVGPHVPPGYNEVPLRMYQFVDELNFKFGKVKSDKDLIHLLAYAHHRIVFIHPFNNGNGRTARLLTNLIALLKGYDQIILYHREGQERSIYLKAVRTADNYDYSLLEELIKSQLKKLD